MNFDSDCSEEYWLLVTTFDRRDVHLKQNKSELDTKHRDDTKHRESPSVKTSIEEALKVELKDLPPHVFLGRDYTFPIIISSDLNVHLVECLVGVLKRFK